MISKKVLRHSKSLNLKYIPSKRILHLDGPLGSFRFFLRDKIIYLSKERKFWLSPKICNNDKSVFFLSQVLLNQSCLGVVLGYRCQLNLVGVGYSVLLEEKNKTKTLVLKLGFSHIIKITVPDYLRVTCPKPRTIFIQGINLQKVNNFMALLRDLKLPNPYKEKGLYYINEVLKLKQGKKT